MNYTFKLNKCREILYKYPCDTPIDNNDFIFLMENILPSHPKYHNKIGCGVKSIVIKETDYYNNKCFFEVPLG